MQAAKIEAAASLDAFVVHAGEGADLAAWRAAEQMRDAGLAVALGAGGSFKSQMKKADASGARYAVILGDAEVQSGKVSVKPLRRDGEQRLLPLQEAINEMR